MNEIKKAVNDNADQTSNLNTKLEKNTTEISTLKKQIESINGLYFDEIEEW